MGVRARRADVAAVLRGSGFEVAPRPEGTETRATYFVVSDRVPEDDAATRVLMPLRRGGKSRAERMAAVLADGRWHSRREIWEAAGGFFLTNNAAAELRTKHGKNVVYDARQDAYRIAPAAAMRAPRAVSISGDPRRRVA